MPQQQFVTAVLQIDKWCNSVSTMVTYSIINRCQGEFKES